MSDPIQDYDDKAEAFYKDTGLMAPGKDEPAGASSADMDRLGVRLLMWGVWSSLRTKSESQAQEIAALKADNNALRDGLDDLPPCEDKGCVEIGPCPRCMAISEVIDRTPSQSLAEHDATKEATIARMRSAMMDFIKRTEYHRIQDGGDVSDLHDFPGIISQSDEANLAEHDAEMKAKWEKELKGGK